MAGEIFYLSKKRTFSLAEAQALVPVIHKITKKASMDVQRIIDRIEKVLSNHAHLMEEQEAAINLIMENWRNKILKLGAQPQAAWVVDFNSGENRYFCWKYPETRIEFCYGLNEDFRTRKKIDKTEMAIV